MGSAPRDATSSSSSTSRSVAGDLVSVALPSLSRYAGSGAAMLRNGGAAVRHYADVARGGRGARPSSWSPGLTIGVERAADFCEGIDLRPSEVDALLAGEGDDLVARVAKPTRGDGGGHSTPPGHARGAGSHPMGSTSNRQIAAWRQSPAPPRAPRRDPPRRPSGCTAARSSCAAPPRTPGSGGIQRSPRTAGSSRWSIARASIRGGTSTRKSLRRGRVRWLVDDAGGGVERGAHALVGGDSARTPRAPKSCARSPAARGCGWGPSEPADARGSRPRCPPGWC